MMRAVGWEEAEETKGEIDDIRIEYKCFTIS